MEVQCYCTECKIVSVRQEMNVSYDRFVNLFEMFKRLNWLYQGESLGCKVKFVYSNDNFDLYEAIKTSIFEKHGFVNNYDFKKLVSQSLAQLNELRNEYIELREVYNQAKYYKSTYDTIKVEGDNGTNLVCSCGNEDIFIISPNAHLNHLYVTKDDVDSEFDKDESSIGNGLYSDDSYDYSQDPELNAEIRREYKDIREYNNGIRDDQAVDEFYSLASTYTWDEMIRHLGKSYYYMQDIVNEYYLAHLNRIK